MHPVSHLMGEGVVLPAPHAARPPWWGGASWNRLKAVLKATGFSAYLWNMINHFRIKLSDSTCAATLWGGSPPTLRVVDEDVVDDGGAVRLRIAFDTRAPAWSCVRVSGRG